MRLFFSYSSRFPNSYSRLIFENIQITFGKQGEIVNRDRMVLGVVVAAGVACLTNKFKLMEKLKQLG